MNKIFNYFKFFYKKIIIKVILLIDDFLFFNIIPNYLLGKLICIRIYFVFSFNNLKFLLIQTKNKWETYFKD